MNEFREGHRVKVEIEGVIRETDSHNGCLRISSQGFSHYVYVNRVTDGISTGAKVTVLDPPGWPPQVGDIWEANGMEWFAKKVAPEIPGQQDECILMSPDDAGASWNIGLLKGLNPALVRRRGQ